MPFASTGRTRSRLLRATSITLAGLVVAGLLFYADSVGPKKVWRREISNPDPPIRKAAWVRLQREGEIRGLDRAGTIAEVFAALDDPDPETRLLAIGAIPPLAPDPLVAIPKLDALRKDKDDEIRANAASAIGDVFVRKGPGREEAIAAITKALKDPVATVRVAGLSALGRVIHDSGEGVDLLRSSRPDDPALSFVVDRLKDPDLDVRVEAAYVLACNDRGVEAVPMLTDYLKGQPSDQPPTHTADRAFLALMVLAIQSDEAARFLCDWMAETREGSPERPRDALAWAARQSAEARLKVKRLAGNLLDPANPSLRHNAGLLLHAIGSDQSALPVLIEAIHDESVDIRIAAVEALADLPGNDPTVLGALEAASKDERREVRDRAAAALEAIEWAEILSEIEGKP